ncbi:MAG: hypothetical protein J6386_14470 [Candidatus Synoicihabitans palmerolidicus]|nr:hypothetical protein [Candidatus Synoicihabitans palmerolidicus]
MDRAIRTLEPTDQKFLLEMLYTALWNPPDEQPRPRTILNDPRIKPLVKQWGSPHDFGLIAYANTSNTQLGAIWSRLDRSDHLEDYGCPYPCLGIAVATAQQNQGLGHFLMGAFITALRPRITGLRRRRPPQRTTAPNPSTKNTGFSPTPPAPATTPKCSYPSRTPSAGKYPQPRRQRVNRKRPGPIGLAPTKGLQTIPAPSAA